MQPFACPPARPSMFVVQIELELFCHFLQWAANDGFQFIADDLSELVRRGLGHGYPATHSRPSQRGTRCLRFFHLMLRSRVFSKVADLNPAARASSLSHSTAET